MVQIEYMHTYMSDQDKKALTVALINLGFGHDLTKRVVTIAAHTAVADGRFMSRRSEVQR